jgi:NAD(P)H-hydrate epimerase
MDATELRDGAVTLPRRRVDTHKGDYGKVLIIGGAVGYTGAPTLCARAAVRAGAGLVYLGVPAPIYEITAVKNDEAMPFPLPAESGGVSPEAVGAVLSRLEGCDVCALGPGMGKGAGTAAVVRAVLESGLAKPLVLDADALNVLKPMLPLLRAYPGSVILTPHGGEFARLGGENSGGLGAEACRGSARTGAVLVLKNHRTVLAFPDGEVYITTHGNPGMAKGGSGDALTGILAAMLGQLPFREAVRVGVHLHGLAGDLCAARLGEYAMTATDLIETLPEATLRMLENKAE